MADALILDHMRLAHQILSRNVTHTISIGGAEHITRQTGEVVQFFMDAERHRRVFPDPEFGNLQISIQTMVQCLQAALPVSADTASTTVDPTIPPSQMHRGLEVPEIAWMIVSQLDRGSREGRAALAALAQCRIFHDPALDALWRGQGTIRNLIKCMPDDLWEIVPVRRRLTMRLRRQIRAADWDRVLEYSHRIRLFSVDSNNDLALSEVFDVLRLNVPGDYLLPNLEMLDWQPNESTTPFSNINLFLGPRLKSIILPALSLRHLPPSPYFDAEIPPIV
ncbi:hypothetical protein MSAN_00856000 [Mycena sanguinolenta]|uniref:Uncharacterized protein n=1 Tax=Mycena sanguinolenta TaxID=230812 RepID=A0A8H6Z127_9AGAR|nr:hypothetical protein MSAN_00856000 [Mycena sanguinolenta]